MKKFETEIREIFDKQYVKVFLSNQKDIGLIKTILEQIDSIGRVNITESNRGGVNTMTLTVYPKRMHEAKEVEMDIVKCLSKLETKSPVLEQIAIESPTKGLDCCPEAKNLYAQALSKFNLGHFERNVLDDMRLCLELFLKCKLGNEKSLENQLEFIGKYQKERGYSAEFVNMFSKVLDYYCKYQNKYVKHNDKVNPKEIDFVIKLTIDFINSF